LCLLVADTADTTVVSAVCATTRHDRHVPNHFHLIDYSCIEDTIFAVSIFHCWFASMYCLTALKGTLRRRL